jgi:hypothetical protein
MTSKHGRLLVLGGNPLHGSDALDSRMGACLWDLSRGHTLVMGDMLSSGGFATACLQVIAKGGSSILGRPGQTRAMFQASTPVDLFTL